MQASQVPANFNIPFANNAAGGYIRTIPQASQIGVIPGAASLTDGFPPLTFQAVSAGGVPPFGQDFNGILNQVTAWTRWQQAGGVPSYNAAFSAAIGGYPMGAALIKADGTSFWRSLVDNNTSNPDAGGAGWGVLSATSTAWTSVTGRPTDLAAFTNSPQYTTLAAVQSAGYLTSVPYSIITGAPAFVVVGSRWGYGNHAASAVSGNVNYQNASGAEAGVSYSGGAVTVNTGGTYQIEGTVSSFMSGGYGGNTSLTIYKNGAATIFVNRAIDGNNDGGHYNIGVTGMLLLAAGDTVSMRVDFGNGASIEAGYGSFTGHRVA